MFMSGVNCSDKCPKYFQKIDGYCVRCSKFTDLSTGNCVNKCEIGEFVYMVDDPLYPFI